LVVPAAAIQRTPRETFVYVVKPDHTIEKRSVTVGVTQGDVATIGSGVTVGELLVTDGVDKVQAGTKVSVQMASSKAAGQRKAR
jgi:membrane fusion protein, multidrug efflux system